MPNMMQIHLTASMDARCIKLRLKISEPNADMSLELKLDHRKYNYLYILSLLALEFSGSVLLINIAPKIKIFSLLSRLL